METEAKELIQNRDEQSKEISLLKELLDKQIKDKEAVTVELSSEIENLSSQNEIKGLIAMENDIKTLSNENEIVKNERDNLKMSVENTEKERGDLSNQLKDIVDKSTALSSELEKARLLENKVQMLLAENQKLKDENLMLLDNLNKKLSTVAEENERIASELFVALDSITNLESKLEQQAQYIANLQETNKELEATKTDMYKEVSIHQEEKNTTIAQLQQVEASVNNLQSQLEQQLEKISHMEKTNDSFIADVENKLEQQDKHISNLQMINTDLEATKADLYNEVMVLQEEKVAALAQLQQFEASMKNLESQLEQQLDEI